MKNMFLSKHLDFRVQLFNVAAIAGVIISFVTVILNISNGVGFNGIFASALSVIFSSALLYYSYRSGNYQLCYRITCFVIFLALFPVLFLTAGGYKSGMPAFFVFAVVFTALLVEGVLVYVIIGLELAVYTGLCIFAYHFPEHISQFSEESEILLDTIIGFIIVSITLGTVMLIYFRMYNRKQRDLEVAQEEALRLSEVKNIFLANMSHEIRTPINVMLGMNEMVLRESPDTDVAGYARKIQNAGKMLLMLVDNILDVSKIEADKLEIWDNRYHTAELIQELFDIGTINAAKKGLAFDLRVDDHLPCELLGDISRIKQVISNFLSNAVKYNENGSIMLEFACCECENPDEILFRISVSDMGIGIRKENIPILFDAFTRMELQSHKNIEGTGLGLSIAKQLTQLMNGQIFVESEYGKGSTFWVDIPQKVLNSQPIENWKSTLDQEDQNVDKSFTAPDAKILVVDDNKENLEMIRELLRRTLAHVDVAHSGLQALNACKKTEYHIILMDYMMPEMDGAETLHRLRREIPDFSTPVIVLTANVMRSTEEKLLGEGFDAYITKPVNPTFLERVISSFLPDFLVSERILEPQRWITTSLKQVISHDLSKYGVDLEAGLRCASGDLLLLSRIADTFIESNLSSCNNMKKTHLQKNAPEFNTLRHLSHSLKSSAGFVGAGNLSALARRIEQACSEQDHKAIELAMPLLYLEWDRAIEGLTKFVAHIHAIEPINVQSADKTEEFDSRKFCEFVQHGMRYKAIHELDLLIEKHSETCPSKILETKEALRKLDFKTAECLAKGAHIWEGDRK